MPECDLPSGVRGDGRDADGSASSSGRGATGGFAAAFGCSTDSGAIEAAAREAASIEAADKGDFAAILGRATAGASNDRRHRRRSLGRG